MPAAKSSKTKKLAVRPKKVTARAATRRPVASSRRGPAKAAPKATAAKSSARKAASARPARKSMLKAKPKAIKSSAKKVLATLKSAGKAKRPLAAKIVAKIAAKVPARPLARLNPAVQKPTARPGKSPVVSPSSTPARGARAGNSGGVVVPIRPQSPQSISRPAKAPRAPRRPRLKIPHDSVPTAAWFPQPNEPRPRSSSFIPAPPRAESPSLVAAPPASSDRLFREDDLEVSQAGIRTVPVRVDMEQGGGKTWVIINPEQITVKAGDGIEWDFRYVGGSDASIDEVSVEFAKHHPFAKGVLKSRKPGSARPHRQVSGIVPMSAVGSQIHYVIHCLNLMKTEIANGRGQISVIA